MPKQSKPKHSSQTSTDKNLYVKVFSPLHVYYEGQAVSLSATNKTGPFDILPGHANFFSLLLPGKLAVDTGQQKHEFDIKQSIMKVSGNSVVVFASA